MTNAVVAASCIQARRISTLCLLCIPRISSWPFTLPDSVTASAYITFNRSTSKTKNSVKEAICEACVSTAAHQSGKKKEKKSSAEDGVVSVLELVQTRNLSC
jgi:hypothetical protein